MKKSLNIEPDRVEKAIERLLAIDHSDEYAYENAFLAFLSIKMIPAVIFQFEPGLELYRTRTHMEDSFFKLVDEISLPKHSIVKNFARCNRPYQAKFYCAGDRQTSFIELANYWAGLKEEGEHLFVTIGKWYVNVPVRALIVVSPNENERTSEFHRLHGVAYDQIIEDWDENAIECCRIFYSFLYKIFSSPAYDDPLIYVITSAYCNTILSENDPNIDAIYYPSVPFGQQGVNFAFDAKFITKDNLTLTDAMQNRMTVYYSEEGRKSFRQTGEVLATSIDHINNNISWPSLI